MSDFEIFLSVPPGLEPIAVQEASQAGFDGAIRVPGGVTLRGGWREVWRANLALRCPSRVLARFGSFRAFHLAQRDKRAQRFDWGDVIAPGQGVRVEVTCRKSKIYHAGAAKQRIEKALTGFGAVLDEGGLRLMVRIDDNLVTLSLDTSGEPLHRRGFKQAVNKAPMRETMAAAFLRAAGYDGTQTVLDPMCGSGTFVIEAAEIAAGLQPGRDRSFAFETLPGFDAATFAEMRAAPPVPLSPARCFGSDRDQGAVGMSEKNAARAGVAGRTSFACTPISALHPPEAPPGLVIVNPPYGARVGNKKPLFALYGSFGQVMKERFAGWRVAMITTDEKLARATGLTWHPPGPHVAHGGLKVRLWQADL